jgi:hypothetical protein
MSDAMPIIQDKLLGVLRFMTCKTYVSNVFWNKALIFVLCFLSIWTISKLPFYMEYDANDREGGTIGSINLVHWLKGFHGQHLRTPAKSFLLLHSILGITVVMMMVLSMVKRKWRKKYGYQYFTISFLLGAHTLPAALLQDIVFTKILFTCTCLWVMASAIYGFKTLSNYDKDPVQAEKELSIEYSLITLGASGAGMAEGLFMIGKFLTKKKTGSFPSYGSEAHSRFGLTIYDKLPEKAAMEIALLFIFIVWFIWPLHILVIEEMRTDTVEGENERRHADETTPLSTSTGPAYSQKQIV